MREKRSSNGSETENWTTGAVLDEAQANVTESIWRTLGTTKLLSSLPTPMPTGHCLLKQSLHIFGFWEDRAGRRGAVKTVQHYFLQCRYVLCRTLRRNVWPASRLECLYDFALARLVFDCIEDTKRFISLNQWTHVFLVQSTPCMYGSYAVVIDFKASYRWVLNKQSNCIFTFRQNLKVSDFSGSGNSHTTTRDLVSLVPSTFTWCPMLMSEVYYSNTKWYVT